MADSDILGTQEVLCQELDQIEERRRRRCGAPQSEPDDGADPETRAQRLKLNALCLSGGGIRSAAFCLGVLQALAEKRLLGRFDYLSTVSGGGFIGGWLQILIRECGGIDHAEAAIDQARPEALRRLRAYTNYLTPQTGPLSVDTWAGIVLYLRNLLINWAVFAPLFPAACPDPDRVSNRHRPVQPRCMGQSGAADLCQRGAAGRGDLVVQPDPEPS